MNSINYIITGTGRCGTVYLARLLTSLGIPCGHESIFTCYGIDEAIVRLKKPIIVSVRSKEYDNNWLTDRYIEAESSYLSAPLLNHPLLENVKIIHLVRDPIRVIFSLCNEFGYFRIGKFPFFCEEKFIHEQMLEHGVDLKEIDDPYLRGTLFYIKWNEMIEKKCVGKNVLFHRIEDEIQPILDFIEQPKATQYFSDKRANTKRHCIFNNTIHDIPDSEIKDQLIEKSNQYGYNVLNQPKAPRMLF